MGFQVLAILAKDVDVGAAAKNAKHRYVQSLVIPDGPGCGVGNSGGRCVVKGLGKVEDCDTPEGLG